ncbi:hypothetical protein [uncultured Methanobrevibacter sp.]|uniref:hypothetical protein n=1 Tax=uncultured Methanobrevibacter sp. TaxID=253161 RepID=UPI0025FD948D|nr:hypothetical protein [uncultured Methanobrevibacter sp.]
MNFILKKIYAVYLDYEQRQVTKLYKSEGLTRKVLNKQAQINEKRHELNLPDRHEMIYKRFVQ